MQFLIYHINLDPTVGHEIKKTRPGVVISPDEMNASLGTVIVAPMTSKDRDIPTRVKVDATPDNGLTVDSFIVLDQIRTIDKSRLVSRPIGKLTDAEAGKVSSILCQMFTIS